MKNISINEILYQYEQCVNEKEHINSMSFKSSDELKNKYMKLQVEVRSFCHSENFLSIMKVLCRINAGRLVFNPSEEKINFSGATIKPLFFDFKSCFNVKDEAKKLMLSIKQGSPKDEGNIINLCVGYNTLISISKKAKELYIEALNEYNQSINEKKLVIDDKINKLENQIKIIKDINHNEDSSSIFIARKRTNMSSDKFLEYSTKFNLTKEHMEENISLSVNGLSSLFINVSDTDKSTEKFHNFISGIFYKNFQKFCVGELSLALVEDTNLSSLPLSQLNRGLLTHDEHLEANLYSFSYGNVASNKDSATNLIFNIYNEMNERKPIFGPTGQYHDIDEYNNANKYNKKSKILLLINGYKEVINPDKTLSQLLALIKDGAKFGIFVIILGENVVLESYSDEDEKIDFTKYGTKLLDFNDQTVSYISCNKQEVSKIRIDARKSIKQNEILYLDELLDNDLNISDFAKEMTIPVGLADGKIYYFATSVDGSKSEYQSSPFTLIIGSTGMGKSAFIHTLILSGGMCYSPDELQFYIVDFKAKEDSAEFSCYLHKDGIENLYIPHIKYLSMKSKAENAYDVLDMINNLSDERAKLFSSVGAKDFIAYNSNPIIKEKIKNKELPPVPQIYFIIDEYITMLSGGVEGDNEAQATLISDFYKILTRVRTSGVGIIFSGQRSIFNTATMGLIGNRISFDPGNEGLLSSMFSFDIMNGEDPSTLYRQIGGKIGTAAFTRQASSSKKDVVRTAFSGSHMGRRQLDIAKKIREKYSDERYYGKQIIPGEDVMEIGDSFLLEEESKPLSKAEILKQSKEGELNVPLYIGMTSMTSKAIPVRYYLSKNHGCIIYAKQSKQEIVEMNLGISFLRYLAINNNIPKNASIVLNDYVVQDYFTDAFGNIIEGEDEVCHPLTKILSDNDLSYVLEVNNSAYDICSSIINYENLRLERFNALTKKKKFDRSPILFIVNNANWLLDLKNYLDAEMAISEEEEVEETSQTDEIDYDKLKNIQIDDSFFSDLGEEFDMDFDDIESAINDNDSELVNMEEVKVSKPKTKNKYTDFEVYNALKNLILDGNKQNIYVVLACDDTELLKKVTSLRIEQRNLDEKYTIVFGSDQVRKSFDSSKDENQDCCFIMPLQSKIRLYDYSLNAKKYWQELRKYYK